jgi:hypothetical protein
MNPPTYAELTSEPSLFNGSPRVIPGDQTDSSLLLRKARGELTHGGGTVWLTSNPNYITVRTWIREGSPNNLTFMRGH